GEDAARAAEAAFDRVFREHAAPDDVPDAEVPAEAASGETVYLPALLAILGLAASRSEGRRLVAQGGVKVDGVTVSSEEVPLVDVKGALLQVGKRRFVRLLG
ncbi:MAG: S4 domain-containing protein, partial [Actinomycetota bacterium]|nr:S4 domain-containing protein [Actinomycetota bacterium]